MPSKPITLEDIYKEIEIVKERIIEIENHMVDIDNIMTEDDYSALVEYEAEKLSGKLTSHAELKSNLGL